MGTRGNQPERPEMSTEEFRQVRESWGLSQAKMAEAVGVTQQAVSAYERGERTVRGPIVLLIERMQAEREG